MPYYRQMSGGVSKRVYTSRRNVDFDGGVKKAGLPGSIGIPVMLRRFVAKRAPDGVKSTSGPSIPTEKPDVTFDITDKSIPEETLTDVGYISADGTTVNQYTFVYTLLSNTNNFELSGNLLKTKNDQIQNGTQTVQIKAVSNPGNHEYTFSFDIEIENVYDLDVILNESTGYVGDFGWSAAINAAGDTVIVGANLDNKAYIYKNTGGTWNTGSPVILSQTSGNFGYSVAINAAGDTVIVGAHVDNKVYIYKNTGGTWNTGSPVILSQSSGKFGASVAINAAGDTVIVGDNVGNRAYIYKNIGGTWTPVILNESTGFTGEFGYSVSINAAGDTVIVGTEKSADGINPENKAYIYSQTNGQWNTSPDIVLTPQGNQLGFGNSVAINAAGDTVIVGAYSSNNANIYKKTNGVWNTSSPVILSQSSGFFGTSVAINAAGDTVIVGAYVDNKAYIYKNTDGVWNTVSPVILNESTGEFGWSVAINAAGDTVIVGTEKSADGINSENKAYIYS